MFSACVSRIIKHKGSSRKNWKSKRVWAGLIFTKFGFFSCFRFRISVNFILFWVFAQAANQSLKANWRCLWLTWFAANSEPKTAERIQFLWKFMPAQTVLLLPFFPDNPVEYLRSLFLTKPDKSVDRKRNFWMQLLTWGWFWWSSFMEEEQVEKKRKKLLRKKEKIVSKWGCWWCWSSCRKEVL